MSILKKLLNHLEMVHPYQLPDELPCFLIDDETRQSLQGANTDLDEQLFIQESQDTLDVALYIAPSIVEHLEQDPPTQRLHAGNLDAFCVALEGLSHLVFLSWRTAQSWPVSALEIELQAEVDKFVLGLWLQLQQGAEPLGASKQLLFALFENYQLSQAVLAQEKQRYLEASQLAAKICYALIKKCRQHSFSQHALLIEARSLCLQPFVVKASF